MSAPIAHAGADLRVLRAAVFAAVCVVLSAGGHMLGSCTGVPWWTLGAGFLAVLAVAAPLAGRERSLPGIAGLLAAGQLALHALFGLGQHFAGAQAAAAQARPAAAGGGPSEGTLIAVAARLLCGADGGPLPLSADRARQIVSASGIEPSHLAGDAGHMAEVHGAGAHTGGSLAGGSPSLGDAVLPTLPMLLAHLLAAVVLGLLLRRGEAALFRLVRLSARGVAEGVAEGALVRALRAALALVRALRAGLPGAYAALLRAPRADGHGQTGTRSQVLEHSVSRRGPPRLCLAA
ncbi:hypothetical protein AB0C51_05715 [Streptomyces pathocidini]|uniref:hypothetical protein n=1 Tax=Streptomyces pathocidini TaxID=1650571 RepID=UPI0033C73571